MLLRSTEPAPSDVSRLRRRAIGLEYVTIAWNVLEVFASAVVVWELRVADRGRERRSVRAIGLAYLVDGSLARALLVGLVLAAGFERWWADVLLAIAISLLEIREGRGTWNGEASRTGRRSRRSDGRGSSAAAGPGASASPGRLRCRLIVEQAPIRAECRFARSPEGLRRSARNRPATASGPARSIAKPGLSLASVKGPASCHEHGTIGAVR